MTLVEQPHNIPQYHNPHRLQSESKWQTELWQHGDAYGRCWFLDLISSTTYSDLLCNSHAIIHSSTDQHVGNQSTQEVLAVSGIAVAVALAVAFTPS